jgi:aryl-alcohol dehydrogenase-like predicted oxidoreductase
MNGYALPSFGQNGAASVGARFWLRRSGWAARTRAAFRDGTHGGTAIRVLAGGALSGSTDRHPNAAANVDPIASSSVYAADVALARRLAFLIEDGYADSLAEAAIRFAIGKDGVSTTLVGISNADQWEQALMAASKGPLPPAALGGLARFWAEEGAES